MTAACSAVNTPAGARRCTRRGGAQLRAMVMYLGPWAATGRSRSPAGSRGLRVGSRPFLFRAPAACAKATTRQVDVVRLVGVGAVADADVDVGVGGEALSKPAAAFVRGGGGCGGPPPMGGEPPRESVTLTTETLSESTYGRNRLNSGPTISAPNWRAPFCFRLWDFPT